MPKYHMSDGEPKPCSAGEGNCPLGASGEEPPHFEGSLKDARTWAEEQNAEQAGGSFNTSAGSKKNSTVDNTENSTENNTENSAESSRGDTEDREKEPSYESTLQHIQKAAEQKVKIDSYQNFILQARDSIRKGESSDTAADMDIYTTASRSVNEMHREMLRHRILGTGAPEWIADASDEFSADDDISAGKLSPVRVSGDHDGEKWRMVLSPQRARAAYYKNSSEVTARHITDHEPDTMRVVGTTSDEDPKVYVEMEDGKYVATKVDGDGVSEQLTPSRSLSSLKKKVSSHLNPRKAVEKHNESFAEKTWRGSSVEKRRLMLENRNTEAEYRRLKRGEKEINPVDDARYDGDMGLRVQSRPTHRLVSRDSGMRAFVYDEDSGERVSRSMSRKQIETQPHYTLSTSTGDVIREDDPWSNEDDGFSGVKNMMKGDEGVLDGIADMRKRYGSDVSDSAYDALMESRNSAWGQSMHPESYGHGDDAQGVQSRLQAIADRGPLGKDDVSGVPVERRTSSAHRSEGHQADAYAEKHNSVRSSALKALRLMHERG